MGIATLPTVPDKTGEVEGADYLRGYERGRAEGHSEAVMAFMGQNIDKLGVAAWVREYHVMMRDNGSSDSVCDLSVRLTDAKPAILEKLRAGYCWLVFR